MRERERQSVSSFAVPAAIACVIAVASVISKQNSLDDWRRGILAVEDGVQTRIEHGWYPNHIGIAERTFLGAFSYYSKKPGAGTMVRLYRSESEVESGFGGSHFEIAFQLPSPIEVGKPYLLRPIPANRTVTRNSQHTRSSMETAIMRPGEFTALQYGHPMLGLAFDDDPTSTATVTIRETDEFETVIHVRLAANLKPAFAFDIDQEYTLRTMADGAR